MKLFLFVVSFALCFLGFGRSLDDIKKSGVLKIAVDGETPGFNYFVGKKLTGFEVDLATEMAMALGLKVEWVVQPFNSLLVGLKGDRFDLIATSHAITPEREKVVSFLAPHYCTGAVIVSLKGGPRTQKDLAGKIVVVPVGTVYFDYLKKDKSIKELRTLPNENAGFQNLLNHKADAWVTERFVALQAVKSRGHKDAQLGEILFPQRNAMVVSKGNEPLQTALNASLTQLMTNGSFARLSQKYFEEDIRCR